MEEVNDSPTKVTKKKKKAKGVLAKVDDVDKPKPEKLAPVESVP